MPVDDRKEPGRPQHRGYRLRQGGLVRHAVQRVGKRDEINRLGEHGGKIARIGGDPLAHGDALVLGFAPRPRDQVRVEVEGIHPAAEVRREVPRPKNGTGNRTAAVKRA